MATLSLCMIVKDEAPVLARCLDCMKHIADEIIIIDTGSKDDTKQIALQYTEHVYDFTWKDNFSEARNFAFSKATRVFPVPAAPLIMAVFCSSRKFSTDACSFSKRWKMICLVSVSKEADGAISNCGQRISLTIREVWEGLKLVFIFP